MYSRPFSPQVSPNGSTFGPCIPIQQDLAPETRSQEIFTKDDAFFTLKVERQHRGEVK